MKAETGGGGKPGGGQRVPRYPLERRGEGKGARQGSIAFYGGEPVSVPLSQPGRAHAPGAVIQEGMRALGGDLDASVLSAAL